MAIKRKGWAKDVTPKVKRAAAEFEKALKYQARSEQCEAHYNEMVRTMSPAEVYAWVRLTTR